MTAVAGVNDDVGSHPEPTEHGFALGPYSVLTSVGEHRKRDEQPDYSAVNDHRDPDIRRRAAASGVCHERHGDPGSVDGQRLMAEAEEQMRVSASASARGGVSRKCEGDDAE